MKKVRTAAVIVCLAAASVADAADTYDVAHKRAGLPGASPPRRQAGQRLVDDLRAYAIRRVHEDTNRVASILSTASWAEAEEVVDRLLDNPALRKMLEPWGGDATEGERLLEERARDRQRGS